MPRDDLTDKKLVAPLLDLTLGHLQFDVHVFACNRNVTRHTADGEVVRIVLQSERCGWEERGRSVTIYMTACAADTPRRRRTFQWDTICTTLKGRNLIVPPFYDLKVDDTSNLDGDISITDSFAVRLNVIQNPSDNPKSDLARLCELVWKRGGKVHVHNNLTRAGHVDTQNVLLPTLQRNGRVRMSTVLRQREASEVPDLCMCTSTCFTLLLREIIMTSRRCSATARLSFVFDNKEVSFHDSVLDYLTKRFVFVPLFEVTQDRNTLSMIPSELQEKVFAGEGCRENAQICALMRQLSREYQNLPALCCRVKLRCHDLTRELRESIDASIESKTIEADGPVTIHAFTAFCDIIGMGVLARTRSLVLNENVVDDNRLQILCTAVTNNKTALSNLEIIDLKYNTIGDVGAKTLSLAIDAGALPKLHTIILNNNNLSENSMRDLASSASRIRTLGLWGNRIKDEGIIALLKETPSLQSLETLNVGHNEIRSSGMQSLADAVRESLLPNLRRLTVSQNGTDFSNEALVSACSVRQVTLHV